MSNITFPELIASKREHLNTQIRLVNDYSTELEQLRGQDNVDPARVEQLRTARAAAQSEIERRRPEFETLERAYAEDQAEIRDASVSIPTGPAPIAPRIGFDNDNTTARAGELINVATGERAALAAGQSFRSHPAAQRSLTIARDEQAIGQYGALGQMVRALTLSGGGAIVPTVWAADIIDRARQESAIFAAGATIVPMDAATVKVGRLTGDPTATFRDEGEAITPSDPVLDNVTLSAKSMSTLVIGSLEWFQDADNADQVVSNAIAKAMAAKLDEVALYGGLNADQAGYTLVTPPNPRGVIGALSANLPANILGNAANGTTQAAPGTGNYYAELLSTLYKSKVAAEMPNALIWGAKLAQQYAGGVDTTGQPLREPADIEALPKFIAPAAVNYTKGTMAGRAADLFIADWTKLLVGIRLDVTLQVLTERYADTGQIGIVANFRLDTQLARNSAFAVFRALQAAA